MIAVNKSTEKSRYIGEEKSRKWTANCWGEEHVAGKGGRRQARGGVCWECHRCERCGHSESCEIGVMCVLVNELKMDELEAINSIRQAREKQK